MERLVQKADFARLLQTAPWSRSAHFAVHHVASSPSTRRLLGTRPFSKKLSTDHKQAGTSAVDNYVAAVASGVEPLAAHWLGCLIPKRHARRAVTRNLLKRTMRQSFASRLAELPHGLWLLRLRSGFAKADFESARSPALQAAARAELDAMLARR